MPKVEINKDRCKGCGFCLTVCKKGVLAWGNDINGYGVRTVVVNTPDNCIGCGLCAIMCPDVCIELTEVRKN